MKISVSNYSFAQYTRQKKMTSFDAIAMSKDIGFDAIEFIDLPGATFEEQKECAKRYREEADRVGIDINAYAINARLYSDNEDGDKREIERVAGQLELAKIMGAPIMRHDVVFELVGRSFDIMLPTIAKNVRAIADIAQEMGIRTCSENHGFVAQDSDRIERLFSAVNHDNYGILVDMGNLICADDDPVRGVSRLAPYAIHAHAKDFHIRSFKEGPLEGYFETRGCNYAIACPLGDGDVPVAQCVKILKKAGYDGYITVEYEGPEDCIEAIKHGREFLGKII
ncbi:MAG: sugar phosphate isomerase/epimerase [Ruminococcaceae bacterium]|nr:sugar phosphate isomerase/epimerase [Oscillospiraceae bacterium]